MTTTNASVLLLYWSSPQSPPSVQRTVDAICLSQSFDFIALNTDIVSWKEQLSTLRFDAVLIHNSVSYFARHTDMILSLIRDQFDGPILLMKQDEHLEPYLFDNLIKFYNISTVFTCVPKDYIATVYPKSSNLDVGTRFVKVEVAYITDDDVNAETQVLPKLRRLTYRGSVQPPQLGRLGLLKVRLPELVYQSRFASTTDWILDLSSRWGDRQTGRAWLDFIANSYAILGSESGSNVFDLDGSLADECSAWSLKFGKVDWDNPAVLSGQFHADVLSKFENNVPYGTFAPRHLEAALQARPQILVSGNYGGKFKSGRTCLMIDESLAGLQDVTQQLNDYEYAALLGATSRHSLLEDEEIHVKTLTKRIDDAILADLANAPVQAVRKSDSPKIIDTVVLSPCPFDGDPRHDWWATIFNSAGRSVTTWSFHYSAPFDKNTLIIPNLPESEFGRSLRRDFLDIQYRKSWSPQLRPRLEVSLLQFTSEPGYELLSRLVRLSDNQDSPGWLSRYFLCNLWAVSQLTSQMIPSIIIANDLVSAFAAVFALRDSGTVVIHDAQEGIFSSQYRSDSTFGEEHFRLFDEIERFVIQRADFTTTVSPGLAAELSKTSANRVGSVPNFVPRQQFMDLESNPGGPARNPRGVFVGNAAPHRGLVELFALWLDLRPKSELHLYIPRSEGRTEIEEYLSSKKNSQARRSIHLHEAVPPDSVVETLTQYDFGVIPYDYYFPLNHCSPNKFGQYIAAGLPILTNFQPFVAETVLQHQVGEVFSLRDRASFKRAIRRLETPTLRSKYRANIMSVRDEVFTWESVASPIVASAIDLASGRQHFPTSLSNLFPHGTSQTLNTRHQSLVARLLDSGIMQWIARMVPAKLATKVGSVLRGQ